MGRQRRKNHYGYYYYYFIGAKLGVDTAAWQGFSPPWEGPSFKTISGTSRRKPSQKPHKWCKPATSESHQANLWMSPGNRYSCADNQASICAGHDLLICLQSSGQMANDLSSTLYHQTAVYLTGTYPVETSFICKLWKLRLWPLDAHPMTRKRVGMVLQRTPPTPSLNQLMFLPNVRRLRSVAPCPGRHPHLSSASSHNPTLPKLANGLVQGGPDLLWTVQEWDTTLFNLDFQGQDTQWV